MPAATNIGRIKNKKVQKNNTSGCTGVTWNDSTGRWCARIAFKKKTYSLGSFSTMNEAISARKRAEAMLFDKFVSKIDSAKTIIIK